MPESSEGSTPPPPAESTPTPATSSEGGGLLNRLHINPDPETQGLSQAEINRNNDLKRGLSLEAANLRNGLSTQTLKKTINQDPPPNIPRPRSNSRPVNTNLDKLGGWDGRGKPYIDPREKPAPPQPILNPDKLKATKPDLNKLGSSKDAKDYRVSDKYQTGSFAGKADEEAVWSQKYPAKKHKPSS